MAGKHECCTPEYVPFEWPPFDPDDDEAIGYIEGQPPLDPNPGFLKRVWYKLTGAI